MKFIESIHQIALILCSLLLMLLLPFEAWMIIPVLLAVILTGIAAYNEQKAVHYGTAGAFIVLTLLLPELYLFIGLISYTLMVPFYWFFLLIPLGLISTLPFAVKLPALLLTVVALLLRYSQGQYKQLRKQYLAQADAMGEMTYTLQKSNRDLIAHQEDDIILATLNERNRIAREIHDHVGHQITSALFQISALLVTRGDDEDIKSVKSTLDQAMTSIRTSVHNLYDTSIDLEAQLQALANGFSQCPVTVNLQWETPLPNAARLSIIAIVKEGFSNISKHANPTLIELNLIEHPGFYQLILTNDGSVSSPNERRYKPGIGLSTMSQRVEALGGRFLVNSRFQGDFTLFMTFPKEQ